MTTLTGELITVDGRDVLRFRRRLPHSPERVWRAVSEPGELAQWFVATVPWTPAAGESFDVMGEPLRITAADPPRTLAWEWGEERYRFDLEADGDGATLLTFTHVFVTTYGPGVQHAAGWVVDAVEPTLLRLEWWARTCASSCVPTARRR